MGEETRRRRLPVSFSAMLLVAAASVAAASVMLHARSEGPRPAARTSQALAAHSGPTPTAVPTAPPLIDILRAADALAQAGKIEAPAPEPQLAEILQAADALSRAGKLDAATGEPSLTETLQGMAWAGVVQPAAQSSTPPSLEEVLRAANVLVQAGLIQPPPPPSLLDVLRAVQALDAAGILPQPEPSLRESLLAAQALAEAAAPPPAPAPAPEPHPIAVAPAPPPPPPPPPAPVHGDGWFDAAYTQKVLDGVNARRRAAGLGTVSPESRLTRAAQDYAVTLANANMFSHTGPDGSTLVSRTEAAGFPFTVQLGEILAMGSQGWEPSGVVQAWIDSPPHHEQMLEPTYTRTGIACYFSNDPRGVMVRCVMDFAAG